MCQQATRRLSFGFVVGLTKNTSVHQQLIEESLRYNDILQVNVYDKYRNLSIKAAGRFNWINLRCSPVDFVLKVDDDVYVNIHNLATILHSFSPIERSIYGHKTGGSQPSRTEGKWPSSYENWPWSRIPYYLQGAGIVVAGSAVRSLLAALQTLHLGGHLNHRISVDEPETYPDPCFVRILLCGQHNPQKITSIRLPLSVTICTEMTLKIIAFSKLTSWDQTKRWSILSRVKLASQQSHQNLNSDLFIQKNIHHRDSIVHQRFSEDDNVKDLFGNVYFIKNGQHRNWIHGGYKRGENERFQ
uniref:Hexosyltransferase n=1 Tax=Daphnia galeata TaxID=27404 RepID=A0A8J2WQX6_9CRUS|nr:unnamed protein product [Daphnia galeata]